MDFGITHAGSDVVFACALIGGLGLGAQWLAWRAQIPAIVVMALAGLAIGPVSSVIFGNPLLSPQKAFGDVFRPVVSLAVAVILFEGGLALKFRDLQEAGAAVRRMIFIGGPLAWAGGTLVARYAANFDWGSAVVFAGVMVVTGPTVIVPLLRQSRLGGRPAQFLRWEGIINDPVGALFAVAAFEIIRVTSTGESIIAAALWIVFAASLGIFTGVFFGQAISRAFRQGWAPEYLKAPIILASIVLCYALAEQIEREIGLVAVTAYGMTLANSKLTELTELQKFKENIAILLVSGVFVMLTADLTPEIISRAMNWNTLVFLSCMLFVVRPLSVWLSTFGTLNFREAILLGWIAPRGIVAVAISGLFGSLLVDLSGTSRFFFSGATQITPLAFAMVFTTVILHGFTIAPLARFLGLARKEEPGILIVGANMWSVGFANMLKQSNIDVIIADNSYRRLKIARNAGLDVFLGEVLSEDAALKLDHARFDTVIALSANNSYNTLVSNHFAPEVGRHKVYQLAISDEEEEDNSLNTNARGRTLAGNRRTHDSLIADHYHGWGFVRTRLSDKYTLDSFRQDRPQADILAELRPDGVLSLIGPDREPRGDVGACLVSFTPEIKNDKRTEKTGISRG